MAKQQQLTTPNEYHFMTAFAMDNYFVIDLKIFCYLYVHLLHLKLWFNVSMYVRLGFLF